MAENSPGQFIPFSQNHVEAGQDLEAIWSTPSMYRWEKGEQMRISLEDTQAVSQWLSQTEPEFSFCDPTGFSLANT